MTLFERTGAVAIARRRVLAGLALAGTIACLGGAGPAAAADSDGAKQFVQTVAGQAIAMMADKSLPQAQLADQFRALFDASFDLPAIGQIVLGRHWKSASDDQRQKFLALFEQQEVLIWAHRFKSYSGQTLSVDSAGPDDGAADRVRVESKIEQSGGQAIDLEWRVAQAEGGWRIVDLAVAGASMALTLRQDFEAVLRSNDGKLEALMDAMRKKIEQLKSAPG